MFFVNNYKAVLVQQLSGAIARNMCLTVACVSGSRAPEIAQRAAQNLV